MTEHHRDFDKAHATRWNYLACTTDARNILNRNIQLEGVCLHTDTNQGALLLEEAKIDLIYGRKYGLVGRNGVGKSTLMRALSEHRIMGIFDHLRILYVDDGSDSLTPTEKDFPITSLTVERNDSTTDDGITAFAYLLAQHRVRVALQKQLLALLEGAHDVDLDALQHVTDELKHLGDDVTEARAHTILNGLGIAADEKMHALSGGYRHRVALATVLFLEADVILLDEPTNHLDIHGTVWLENYLRSIPSTVVVVSHDFHFLDAATTSTIVLERHCLTYYDGSFSHYVATRQIQLNQHKRMYLAQEKRRRQMLDIIARLQAKAERSSTGKGLGAIRSRQQQLKHRLGVSLDGTYWKYSLMGPRPEILAPAEEVPFEFLLDTDVSDIPESAGEGETTLLKGEDVGFCYGSPTEMTSTPPHGGLPGTDNFLFRHLSVTVTQSTRLGIVGQNRTGKTTLLRLLAGHLAHPTEGTITRWCNLRVGYFEQHAVKTLRSELSSLALLRERHPNADGRNIRDALGNLGLLGTVVEEIAVEKLSDGQRARVLLADMMLLRPHVLLLDEPTSHLDAETSSALAAALTNFDGAIVTASHDRSFLEEVTTERLCLDPFMMGPMTVTLDEYKELVLRHIRRSEIALQQQQRPSPHRGPQALDGPHHTAESQPDVSVEEKRALAGCTVKCRYCQGNHLSHACPDKKLGRVSPLTSFEQAEEARRRAIAEQAATQQAPPSKAKLPAMRERASDGQGDWHVAVSKSTMRRLQRDARRKQ